MNTNKKSRKIRSISGKSKTVKPKTVKPKTVESRTPSRNQRFIRNKNKIRNSEIKQIYNRDYYGTELLPRTNILEYTTSISNELLDNYLKRKKNRKKPEPDFDGFL
jgi:hypothetical protein